VADLLELRATLNRKNRREHFHDAVQIKDDAQARFDLGLLDLATKAQVETLFWEIAEPWCAFTRREVDAGRNQRPEGFARRPVPLQLFRLPVAARSLGAGPAFPHRADPSAQRSAGTQRHAGRHHLRFGRQDQQVHRQRGEVSRTLPLHALNGKPYYLGIFLLGAYQDIMGDLHNLFGRVNEAHIFLDPDEESGFYIEETIPGSTIGEVLGDVQYDIAMLERGMKEQIDRAIKADVLKPNEGMRLLESYEQGLKTSTYLQF
jgi:arginine decarboxylase